MSKPSIERINELLSVDIETGVIKWRVGRGRAKAGDTAGRINGRGYCELSIDGTFGLVHQLVYFMAYGDWVDRIDHINGQKTDNRAKNLRHATAAANAQNRTNWQHRKLLGAFKCENGKFRAAITVDGVSHHLGVYDTEDEAHTRYCDVRKAIEIAEAAARSKAVKAFVGLVQADALMREAA